MKVALCCIGRLENRYAVEYVEYYKKLGVDKIFIYDNNYDGEEHFEDVLQPYIDEGLVEITDFRNKSVCQLEAYQDCYNKHGNEYDWIAFFDFDEYLTLQNKKTIQELLSLTIYENYDMIHVNELIYGDSGEIKYDSKPLVDRLLTPVLPLNYKKTFNFPENCHIKSIIRGGKVVLWNGTPHTPTNELKCCNSVGQNTLSNSPFVIPFDFHNVYLRHYKTKTIEEYYDMKVKRGYPDGNKDFFKKNSWVFEFFTENQFSNQKIAFINDIKKNNQKITIIIPCYNYGNYITETINSLKSSTYDKWQCIIINDGSTDNSEEIILNQISNDKRFTYIKQPNMGVSCARNIGIRASDAKYIMCLDPDDKISATYIENAIKYLDEHDDCTLYYGRAKMFWEDGTEKEWNLPQYDYRRLILVNHIYSSCIYRKEDFNRVGGYDEYMDAYEDWEFLIRLLYGGKKVYMTDDTVFYYRRHDGSKDSIAKRNIERYKRYIYNKNKSLILSLNEQ